MNGTPSTALTGVAPVFIFGTVLTALVVVRAIEHPPPKRPLIVLDRAPSWISGPIGGRRSPMAANRSPVFLETWCNLVQSLMRPQLPLTPLKLHRRPARAAPQPAPTPRRPVHAQGSMLTGRQMLCRSSSSGVSHWCSELCSDRVDKRRTGTSRDRSVIGRFSAGNSGFWRDWWRTDGALVGSRSSG
jgi:hypothetical protein